MSVSPISSPSPLIFSIFGYLILAHTGVSAAALRVPYFVRTQHIIYTLGLGGAEKKHRILWHLEQETGIELYFILAV
jgi:hypothetical protein